MICSLFKKISGIQLRWRKQQLNHMLAKSLFNYGIGHVGVHNVIDTYRTVILRSFWSDVKRDAPDPVYALIDQYSLDKDPNKINLATAMYRNDKGNPIILPCVRAAETKIIAMNLSKDYSPIGGLQTFNQFTIQNALGVDSKYITDGKHATLQTLSGTGAFRVCAEFLKKYLPDKVLYLPNLTWSNHSHIFQETGLKVDTYFYYDGKSSSLDIPKMLKSLQSLPDKSAVVFHACGHNPSGLDPTPEQWVQICDLVANKGMLVVFDMLYLGFASGNVEKDCYAVRLFSEKMSNVILCHCYSKNMGLYGDRCGAISVLTENKATAENVTSQLTAIVRAIWLSPPLHGSRIVITIMSDLALKKQWERDVKTMADRIAKVRVLLKEELLKAGSKINWDRITTQTGMFCNTGLTPEQTDLLVKEHHIYMTRCGRMSMSSVNTTNVHIIGNAIHTVTA